MQSAYATLLGQEPLFTNFTAKFVGTLDYIFYEPHALKPNQILLLPTEVPPHRRAAAPPRRRTAVSALATPLHRTPARDQRCVVDDCAPNPRR